MENSKTIPAGATVYYCRRGLDYRYPSLMKVEKAVVKNRTPLGYKFESRSGNGFHKDEDYYISEDRKEVVRAVQEDINRAQAEVKKMSIDLVNAHARLSNGC